MSFVDSVSLWWIVHSAGGILPVGDFQRKLSGSRPAHTDGVGALRPDEVWPMHARGPRQCRLFGWRPCLPGLEMFRTSTMPAENSRRSFARRSSLSEGADAVSGSELLLHHRYRDAQRGSFRGGRVGTPCSHCWKAAGAHGNDVSVVKVFKDALRTELRTIFGTKCTILQDFAYKISLLFLLYHGQQ